MKALRQTIGAIVNVCGFAVLASQIPGLFH